RGSDPRSLQRRPERRTSPDGHCHPGLHYQPCRATPCPHRKSLMLHAHATGNLEIRASQDGSTRITGRFPYGEQTELQRGRYEVFQSNAFESAGDVYLLSQHEIHQPIASTGNQSLKLTNTPDGLDFEARIAPEVAETSHGRDALALIRSGLAVGLSPGFSVP